MKSAIAIVVCLLFWGGALHSNAAGGISDFHGNKWVNWAESQKGGYVLGFIAGTTVVVKQVSYLTPLITGREVKVGEAIVSFPDPQTIIKGLGKLAISETPARQVMDGLDAFYSDFSKRKIKLVDAIYVVKMQIDGAPEEVVDAQVRVIRTPQSERRKIWDEYFSKLGQYGAEGEKGPAPPSRLEIKAKDGRTYTLWEAYGEE